MGRCETANLCTGNERTIHNYTKRKRVAANAEELQYREIEKIIKGKPALIRFCAGGSLGNAAYDFTSGDEDGAMPTMYVYPSTLKAWACASVPLTLAQLQEAEKRP